MTSKREFEALLAGMHDAGMTSCQIAERSGIARNVIWKIENGHTAEPHLETYLRLGACYQRTLGHPPPPLSFDSKRR